MKQRPSFLFTVPLQGKVPVGDIPSYPVIAEVVTGGGTFASMLFRGSCWLSLINRALSLSSGVPSRRGEGPGCLEAVRWGHCCVLVALSQPQEPELGLGQAQGATAGIWMQLLQKQGQ